MEPWPSPLLGSRELLSALASFPIPSRIDVESGLIDGKGGSSSGEFTPDANVILVAGVVF